MADKKYECYICMESLKNPIYPSGCTHGFCKKHLKVNKKLTNFNFIQQFKKLECGICRTPFQKEYFENDPIGNELFNSINNNINDNDNINNINNYHDNNNQNRNLNNFHNNNNYNNNRIRNINNSFARFKKLKIIIINIILNSFLVYLYMSFFNYLLYDEKHYLFLLFICVLFNLLRFCFHNIDLHKFFILIGISVTFCIKKPFLFVLCMINLVILKCLMKKRIIKL